MQKEKHTIKVNYYVGSEKVFYTQPIYYPMINYRMPVDNRTAKLVFAHNGLSLFFKISFNDIGEITEMETKRYMDSKNLETWVIKVAGYKELNCMIIPTDFEVLWRLEKGDFSYAKFNITQIEYDKPKQF